MADENPGRPQQIDRQAAERARKKIKTVFKGNGGLPDLADEELLVLLADVATEVNERSASGQAGSNLGIGPMRNIARKILA